MEAEYECYRRWKYRKNKQMFILMIDIQDDSIAECSSVARGNGLVGVLSWVVEWWREVRGPTPETDERRGQKPTRRE